MRVSARPEASTEPEAAAIELASPEPLLSARAVRSLASWALVVVQVGLLLAMTATVATKIWQDHYWFGWGLCALTAVAWLPELGKARARRWWFVYVAGIFFYTLLRAYAGKTAIPIQTSYVIDFDHLVFRGGDPTAWLQERLFSVSRVSVLDIVTVQVHWSFFIAPHLMAVIIFVRRRDLFPRYAALMVGIMYAGLLVFFLVPTTPPWLAARTGYLSEAYRVMDFVGGRVSADTYRTFAAPLAEPNAVAAMPSIHMAVTFAMYLWARDNGYRKLAPWLLAYTVVMGVSLVYLAEHYVLDLLAGIACAVAVHAVSRRLVKPQNFGSPAEER